MHEERVVVRIGPKDNSNAGFWNVCFWAEFVFILSIDLESL
jgi:hypothetical protein